jgi:hypothetical protein
MTSQLPDSDAGADGGTIVDDVDDVEIGFELDGDDS